jgi:hypothetical protein
MNITLKQLKAFNACEAGLLWFKQQKRKEVKYILRKLVCENHFDYANWFVTKLFTHPQCVQYSIFSSEICLEQFEKQYPEDSRPREAIEAAKNWLKNPTEENRSAAWYAAEYTAGLTASTAWSAAKYAAWSAAKYAAWSAAYAASAARSAEYAAESAAESAAWSARSALMEKAIEMLGL